MKTLLIGGPHDGEHYEIDALRGPSIITLPVLPTINASFYYDKEVVPDKVVHTAIYKREEFIDSDKRHVFIYVHDSIESIIVALVMGYNPQTRIRNSILHRERK